jgi:hypothetical protein
MPVDPQSFNGYEVWNKVFLHRSEQSFREILADQIFHIRRILPHYLFREKPGTNNMTLFHANRWRGAHF